MEIKPTCGSEKLDKIDNLLKVLNRNLNADPCKETTLKCNSANKQVCEKFIVAFENNSIQK